MRDHLGVPGEGAQGTGLSEPPPSRCPEDALSSLSLIFAFGYLLSSPALFPPPWQQGERAVSPSFSLRDSFPSPGFGRTVQLRARRQGLPLQLKGWFRGRGRASQAAAKSTPIRLGVRLLGQTKQFPPPPVKRGSAFAGKPIAHGRCKKLEGE